MTKIQYQWEDFEVSSLLVGHNSNLSGFKDQILASKTLSTAVNAYYHISCSSLGRHSSVNATPTPTPTPEAPTLDASAFVSSNGGHSNFHGTSHEGYSGYTSRGRG